MNLRALLLLSTVLAAIGIGWFLASTPSAQVSTRVASEPITVPTPAITKPVGWQPPEGDPVQRFQAATTHEAKLEMIGQFMTLGHDRNPAMLIAALKDESIDLRVKAVEYAASLVPEASATVLKEACLNDSKDVRDMGWSLLAPHPMENKAPVIKAAIERSTNAILEETLAEIGRTPEQPLFEAMLGTASNVYDARQARVLSELQAWLKPGGGNVPTFKTVPEMTTWWQANRQRYDSFMLRVDL